jgi:magnesium-transporting ATPase (P-type)
MSAGAGEEPVGRERDEMGGTSAPRSRVSGTPLWLAVTLAVLFGLFYAYDVWEALGNLIGMSTLAAHLEAGINGFGWFLLVIAIVLPLALFAAAFAFGRRRGPLVQIAFYAAGLGVSAALSMDIIAAFTRWVPLG